MGDDEEQLADVLRQLRKQRGVTQEQLAAACDLSSGFIGEVETGRRSMGPKTLEAVVQALDLTTLESARLYRAAGYATLHRWVKRPARAMSDEELGHAIIDGLAALSDTIQAVAQQQIETNELLKQFVALSDPLSKQQADTVAVLKEFASSLAKQPNQRVE
ncbi:MAG TPA: helix-turn-helix transcriptional regulator [Fimbriimonadaceae bacterium]|nr:helix-turn-helix transcriptional regulator [Fimbriimonadaceae bacterium]